MSGVDKRKNERFDVRFKVRFGAAVDFVSEYADNLSVGGLFVRGGHRLEPMSQVEVELELPGFRSIKVGGKVAHIVSPELAARTGKRPGAGLEITSGPPGFDKELREYLRRLGRRRDVAVLAERGTPLDLMTSSGFHAAPVPEPREIVAAMSRAAHPVLAVVVTRARERDYRSVLKEAGLADSLKLLDHEEELDDVLSILDSLL